MIAGKSIKGGDCNDILSLINAINCKLYEASRVAYSNIVYSMNIPIDKDLLIDLLTYKEILIRKYSNPIYDCVFTLDKIANRVRLLTAGCAACTTDEVIVVFYTTTSTTTTTTTLAPAYQHNYNGFAVGACNLVSGGIMLNSEPLTLNKYYYNPTLGIVQLITTQLANSVNPTSFLRDIDQKNSCAEATPTTTTTTTAPPPVNFSFDSQDWSAIGVTNAATLVGFLQTKGLSNVLVSNFSIVNNGTLSAHIEFTGTTLNLSNCRITKINNTDAFESLNILSLADNLIQVAENLIPNFNITYLDISNNQLTHLDEIKNFYVLTTLDISGNLFDNDNNFFELYNIQNLYAKNNRLVSVPNLQGQALVNLDFSNNLITNTNYVGNFSVVIDLNLSDNRITDSELGNFFNLSMCEKLNLAGNLLEMPVSIAGTALVDLDFSRNLIWNFNAFNGFYNAEVFDISGNNLDDFGFDTLGNWATNTAPLNGTIYVGNNPGNVTQTTTYDVLIAKGWTFLDSKQ